MTAQTRWAIRNCAAGGVFCLLYALGCGVFVSLLMLGALLSVSGSLYLQARAREDRS